MTKYLSCLKKTYMARNNEELEEAKRWLDANYGHSEMQQAIKMILTGSAECTLFF